MKKQYTLIASIMLMLINMSMVQAQCPYDNTLYLTGAAPATVGATIYASQTWAGEFNRVTGMQAGYTYEISTCNTPTFDSELTIYPAGGGTAIAHDDDGCGITGGSSKIIFTPVTTGDYDILLDKYGCYSDTVDMEMSVELLSTGGIINPGTVNIPVVVHVVYKNQTENISDSQIFSQIDALNHDYRKLNFDFSNVPSVFQPLGADMEISFCLAAFDPAGNPTTGITRTATTIQSFSQATSPKSTANGGHDNWDPNRYLNIWVCDLTGGLLGYATFPSDLSFAPELDGVAIDYAYFGTTGTATAPFNLGRTATHEIGHWLNLRHIWGDANCGDDFVNDTPVQEQSNYGCPNFPHTTCSNGANGDLFYDYMDYTDDACMMMFTAGQKTRAAATIGVLRSGLISSAGCDISNHIPDNKNNLIFSMYPNPADKIVFIEPNGEPDANYLLKIYDVIGQELKHFETIISMNEKTAIHLETLPKGIYVVTLSNENNLLTRRLVIQ